TKVEARREDEAAKVVVDVGALGERGVAELPGLAVEIGRGAIGGQRFGEPRRLEQRLDRLSPVVAAHEVVREEGVALGRARARLRLEQQTDSLVHLSAVFVEETVVGDLLSEAFAEAKLVVREHVLSVQDTA